MDRCKNTRPCRSAFSHLFCKNAICFFCIFQIFVFRFFRKCIGFQPVKKLHIHSKTPEGILRRMNMKICKSRDNKLIAHIFYRDILHIFRKFRIDPINLSIFTDKITLFVNAQFFAVFCVYNISF